MINLSRRKLIVSGLAATAGASGLAAALRLSQKYGLVPPDHGGIYGFGETLTYASQRLLTRHSLAREFARNRISPRPFPNELAPLTEDFKRLQTGGFVDWRASLPRLASCRGPPTSQIRRVCLDGARYLGQHRYGRRSASADISLLRHEWR